MSFFSYLTKNTIVLSLLTISLLSVFSLTTFTDFESRVYYVSRPAKISVSKLPVLNKTSNFPVLSAQGVYAYDLDSSVILYEKNPDMQLFPASTTKVVTALVSLDNYDLESVVSTGQFSVNGQKMGLVWNERITVENLLYGLLIHSGNDAAEVLASNHPGGRDKFIELMNKKANDLSATNTVFSNPSGLDQESQLTTARDLAKISTHAMRNPVFVKFVSTLEKTANSVDGNIVHHLANKNELLGRVDGVLGVKTGWTESARENLVTYVERDSKKVVIALLGSQDRFGETEQLIEWIYNNYNWQEVGINFPQERQYSHAL